MSKFKDNKLSPINSSIDVHIFCDGGCEPNPGQAGSGIAVYEKGDIKSLHFGLYTPQGTNNSAELNALHEALKLSKVILSQGKTVQILCDSMYSIQCVTLWAKSWKSNNWKKKEGDIKNLDIIKSAHELYIELQFKITVSHIKAHSGFEGNELADRMTMLAIDKKETGFEILDQPFSVLELLAMREG